MTHPRVCYDTCFSSGKVGEACVRPIRVRVRVATGWGWSARGRRGVDAGSTRGRRGVGADTFEEDNPRGIYKKLKLQYIAAKRKKFGE